MISKMLGIYERNYWSFADLGSGKQAKMDRVKTLRDWAYEENVSPILVDELSIEFFSNHNYGKQLILETTNNKIHSVPAFPAEARRRSYYLKIDKVFDQKRRETSIAAYDTVYKKMNNVLFQDFVLRMAERLESWQSYDWNYFGEQGGKVDFLHQSREIFKEYYKEAGWPLPRYFPTDRYNDDSKSNQEKWRKLYKGMGGEHFIFDEDSRHLFLQTTIIDENAARNYQRAESEVYKEALPQYVVHGSLQGINIELEPDEFFAWLEIENPYENYYKDKLISYYHQNRTTIKQEKGRIHFPRRDIAATQEICERYKEHLPKEVLKEITSDAVIVDHAAFIEWSGLEPKRGWLNRILGN